MNDNSIRFGEVAQSRARWGQTHHLRYWDRQLVQDWLDNVAGEAVQGRARRRPKRIARALYLLEYQRCHLTARKRRMHVVSNENEAAAVRCKLFR